MNCRHTIILRGDWRLFAGNLRMRAAVQGWDPATFATELGILPLRGFSDMKEKARDLMVHNKFIAAQRSCDLRRHLDGAAPEASIGDIVDSCRIWESHAEPIAIDNWWQDPVYSQPTLLRRPPATCGSARLQYKVGSVMPASNESPRRVMHSSVDRELLIRNVLEAVGARRMLIQNGRGGRELELLLRDMPPVGSVHGRKDIPAGGSASRGNAPTNGRPVGPWPVFFCGFHGHGVNRCSQLDISFLYKMPGWSVNVRNGQYRASRMRGDGQDHRRGKEGWFGRGGSASQTINDSDAPDPGGGHHPARKRLMDDTHRP